MKSSYHAVCDASRANKPVCVYVCCNEKKRRLEGEAEKAPHAVAYLLHVAFLMEALAALLERANKGTISAVGTAGEEINI